MPIRITKQRKIVTRRKIVIDKIPNIVQIISKIKQQFNNSICTELNPQVLYCLRRDGLGTIIVLFLA